MSELKNWYLLSLLLYLSRDMINAKIIETLCKEIIEQTEIQRPDAEGFCVKSILLYQSVEQNSNS